MIEVQKYVELVETQLNLLAANENFIFKIYPNEGEYYNAIKTSQRELPKDIVFGVLTFMPTTTIPLQNLGIYNVSALLEILAPVTRGASANDDDYGHINSVANIIQTYYAQQTGATGTLTDSEMPANTYKYIFSCNTPQTGTEVTGQFGRAVPLSLMISWQLIENGVLFNDIKITIDGLAAAVTDFSFENVITPQTDNIDNNAYLRSYAQSQSLIISVIMPYTNTVTCKELITSIFDNTLAKTYQVKYSDGYITDQTNRMVAANIKMSGQPGLNCVIQATFVLSR